MNYRIENITNQEHKSEYTEKILKNLPDWFGDESATQEFVTDVKALPYWAAFADEECIGFISVKIHHNRTGDLFVLGVAAEQHGNGMGRLLYKKAEEYFIAKQCDFVLVKTLSDDVNYEPYKRTTAFYRRQGFKELITLTEMWDEENPCLLMIKELNKQKNF
ncbi:GNAT family N-acetyltransferase [Spirochaeta dissipatitropha]